MDCEEPIHPLTDAIAAAASGWTIVKTLIAVEKAVKDIRSAKPAS